MVESTVHNSSTRAFPVLDRISTHGFASPVNHNRTQKKINFYTITFMYLEIGTLVCTAGHLANPGHESRNYRDGNSMCWPHDVALRISFFFFILNRETTKITINKRYKKTLHQLPHTSFYETKNNIRHYYPKNLYTTFSENENVSFL